MPMSYIVMAGEYSDRHVCGVYTTQENADYAARLFNGWVEEFEPDALPGHPKGTIGFVVFMAKDGAAEARPISAELVDHYAGKDDFDRKYRRDDDGVLHATQQIRAYLWARDEQHAVKIVNEKRAQIIAANEWPEDPPPTTGPVYVNSTSLSLPDDPNPISNPIVVFQVGEA